LHTGREGISNKGEKGYQRKSIFKEKDQKTSPLILEKGSGKGRGKRQLAYFARKEKKGRTRPGHHKKFGVGTSWPRNRAVLIGEKKKKTKDQWTRGRGESRFFRLTKEEVERKGKSGTSIHDYKSCKKRKGAWGWSGESMTRLWGSRNNNYERSFDRQKEKKRRRGKRIRRLGDRN